MGPRKRSSSNSGPQGTTGRSQPAKTRPTRDAARRASTAVQKEAEDVDPLVLPTHEEILPRGVPASSRSKKSIQREEVECGTTPVRADDDENGQEHDPVVAQDNPIEDSIEGRHELQKMKKSGQAKKVQTVVQFPKKQSSTPAVEVVPERASVDRENDTRRAPDINRERRTPDAHHGSRVTELNRTNVHATPETPAEVSNDKAYSRSAPTTPTKQVRSRTQKSGSGRTPMSSQAQQQLRRDRTAGKVRTRSPTGHGGHPEDSGDNSARRVRRRAASPETPQRHARMEQESIAKKSSIVTVDDGVPQLTGSSHDPNRAASPSKGSSRTGAPVSHVKTVIAKGNGNIRRNVLLRGPSIQDRTRGLPSGTAELSKGSHRAGSRHHHEEPSSRQSQGSMRAEGARQKIGVKIREDNSHRSSQVDGTVLRELRIVFRTVDELKKKIDSFEGTLNDISAALQSRSLLSSGHPPTTKDHKGAIEKYGEIMNRHAPYVLSYFPDELLHEAVFSATVNLVCSNCSEEMLTFTEMYDIISIIMFSLYQKKKSEAFESTLGKKVSTFRRSIIMEAFRLARAKKYPPNISADVQVVLDDTPYWLRCQGSNMFITPDHMKIGQERNEKCSSNTDDYRKRVKIGNGKEKVEDEDIAKYICSLLYKHLSDSFRSKRRRVIEDFSECFGYLFVPWEGKKDVVVDDRSLDMRWFVPFTEVAILPKSKIPTTLQESTKQWNCFKRNQELFHYCLLYTSPSPRDA